MRVLSSENRRSKLVLILLLSAWVVLLGRMAFVQTVRWKYYRAKAVGQHTDSLRLSADRGRILDRRGRALTLNQTGSLVYVWPSKLKKSSSRVDSLADILTSAGVGTRAELRHEIEKRSRMFACGSWIEQPRADSLWRRLVKGRFGDCTAIERESRRRYPFGATFASVVGFVGKERGLAGLETWYDSVLSGIPGWVLMQKDGSGLELPYPSYPRVEPVSGVDIHLTIDADVQEIVYRALAGGVARTRARHGSAVVLDVSDGAILALAEYPTFDPEAYDKFPTALYKCAPVCDEFEPGSTFKIVVCAAALESPNAAELTSQQFDVSSGQIQVMGRKISDVHRHGILDFDGLIVQSSNPGCAMLAMQLDRTRFYLTARDLGFSEPVGIGLPGEATGRMDRPAKLNALRIANNAFGQGVTVTLLQLAAAYACVANDGLYLRPYLVRSVGSSQGNRSQLVGQSWTVSRAARPGRRVLKPETAMRMKDILAKVVTEGTGKLAAVPGVQVCGKTGTAQKVEPNGTYSSTRSTMTFVGFFPKERPRYVIAVLVDEPVDRFSGTSTCPVFKEIAEQLIMLGKVREREALAQGQGRAKSDTGYRTAGSRTVAYE